jgi:ELWxxDGT repeat protein
MKKVLLLICLGFINYSISSQSIDATKIEINFQADSNPQNLTAVQSGFFFSATDRYRKYGRELWFSNGKLDGTNLVKELINS